MVAELINFLNQLLALKECNYELHATLNASHLTKILVNNIRIYGSQLTYYENTFHN
jgi:hypothetical protein